MIKVCGWEGVLILFLSPKGGLPKKLNVQKNADTVHREVKTYRQGLPIVTGAYPCCGRMKLLELFLLPLVAMLVHGSSHLCKL